MVVVVGGGGGGRRGTAPCRVICPLLAYASVCKVFSDWKVVGDLGFSLQKLEDIL